MTVEIFNGCLLDAFGKGEVNIIGHVVNCQGVMGSGVAKSIRECYPIVFDCYKEFCGEFTYTEDLLGAAQPVYTGSDARVWNLFAQNRYGSAIRDLNYGALGNCLREMADDLDTEDKIGFPFKMGSDRAKGDWSIVLEMIEFYFKDHNVKIYKL